MKQTTDLKGASALLGAALTYASFGLFVREMAKMFGNNAQVAFRFVFAFIFLIIWNLFAKRFVKLPRYAIARSALLGVVFCIVVLLFTISVNLTKLANSVFLLYAGSIISSLLIGTFVLKEKLTAMKLASISLALIGLVMYSSAFLALSLGLVTAVLAGVLDGVSNGLRKTLKGIDRNSVLTYQFGFGALFGLMIMGIFPETPIKIVSFGPIVAGLIFALLQIGLGNLLLYGFHHFDVNVGTVILATELLFATLLGWLFFREIPSTHEIIGGMVIFIASIISTVNFSPLFKRSLHNGVH